MNTERKKPEVTTAIYLETRCPNKEGKFPVKLRITYQRKRYPFTIKGHYYSKKEYAEIINPESRGKNKEKRKKFEAVENRAIDIIDNVLKQFTIDAFKREYLIHKPKKSITVKSLFDAKIAELEADNKIQTANLYTATLKSLQDFDNHISFDKITPEYLLKYQNWMLKKNRTYTTIAIFMRNFKHIINLAIREKLIIDYPFGKEKYQIPHSRNIKKALSKAEMSKLYFYQTDNNNESEALQYFIFSYLCAGINMVDVANLKFDNIKGKYLIYYRQKTINTSKEKKPAKAKFHPKAYEIIKNLGNENSEPGNLIFPIIKHDYTPLEKHKAVKQHIKQTNKYLKRIAAKIEINENITTYWARHTYSTILKNSGTPTEFISETLGHHSLKTTQNYLAEFEDEQHDKYSEHLITFTQDNQEQSNHVN